MIFLMYDFFEDDFFEGKKLRFREIQRKISIDTVRRMVIKLIN